MKTAHEDFANSEKTAISRDSLTSAARWMKQQGHFKGKSILDYGCGRGDDVKHLKAQGFQITGWDPNHNDNKAALSRQYDVVMCLFVLNTLEPHERGAVIRGAYARAKRGGMVVYSVRSDVGSVKGTKKADGVETSKGTFQKDFNAKTLRAAVTAAISGNFSTEIASGSSWHLVLVQKG